MSEKSKKEKKQNGEMKPKSTKAAANTDGTAKPKKKRRPYSEIIEQLRKRAEFYRGQAEMLDAKADKYAEKNAKAIELEQLAAQGTEVINAQMAEAKRLMALARKAAKKVKTA